MTAKGKSDTARPKTRQSGQRGENDEADTLAPRGGYRATIRRHTAAA